MEQRSQTGRLQTTLTLFVGAVFLWAGLLKLANPVAFGRVVAALLPTPFLIGPVPLLISIFIGAFEIGLSVAIIIKFQLRRTLVVAVSVVTAFTTALVILYRLPNAPSCGCLGVGGTREEGDLFLGIVRNAAMLWMLGALLYTGYRRESQFARGAASKERLKAGFTLVEMMICIVIISVIVALVLPAIGAARRSARIAARTQLIRQLGAGLELYCQDYRETFPYFATRGDPTGAIAIRGFELAPIYFRSQRWFWASLVVPDYADAPRHAIESPGGAVFLQEVLGYPEHIISSTFQLTSTAFASPAYWRDGYVADWDRSEHYSPTTLADISFPSKKGLLIADITGPGGYGDQPAFPVSLGDGSARSVQRSDFDLSRAVLRPHGSTGFPVEATKDGLAGWDF